MLKKLAKPLALVVFILALALAIASCGGGNDDELTTSPEGSPTTAAQSCTVTGLHTYTDGKCTGCNLRIFDVMKDFLVENSENVGSQRYLYYCGSYQSDPNFTILEYNAQNDVIIILARQRTTTCTLSTDLYFSEYTLEDGEYEWEGECITMGCRSCTDISGYLDPTKFSKGTSKMPHTSVASGADSMAEKYAKSLKINIEEELIPFLNTLGHNIKIKDLGFIRYE